MGWFAPPAAPGRARSEVAPFAPPLLVIGKARIPLVQRGPFLAMPLKTYSAGMQARLAFAVATAVHADVILMDEWIAVGDADFQKIAHKRILELMERAGILVLASHDLELIRLYCNKVMRIESGVASKIMDVKKLDELLAAA